MAQPSGARPRYLDFNRILATQKLVNYGLSLFISLFSVLMESLDWRGSGSAILVAKRGTP